MVLLVLQAEIRTKTSTIEKNKNNVAAAQRLRDRVNPEGLKQNDFFAQIDQKQARLEELSKQYPELQQVIWPNAVFSTCCGSLRLAHVCVQHVCVSFGAHASLT